MLRRTKGSINRKAPRFYWASRLNARDLFYRKPVHEGADYMGRAAWPEWVSRKALWDDYVAWFEEVYAPVTDRLPMSEPSKPGTPDIFFEVLKPYLYEPGRMASATTFPVVVQEFHRGRWLNITVRRRFIRVPPFDLAQTLYDEQKQKIDAALTKG